jgi:FKBP-type peptidyl-prolyl cis-trans isomerase FkpA
MSSGILNYFKKKINPLKMQQINKYVSLLLKNVSMRIIAMVLLLLGFVVTGCTDNGCKPVKPETEEPQITAYAAANGITATKHMSGMYYQIVTPGSGPTPNINSKVFVTYTGKRLDNTVFDQSASVVSFNLSSLVEGWQVGLPLIKKGGQIRLIVPSSMAYGCTGVPGTIPSNSVLYFDIQLIDVQ